MVVLAVSHQAYAQEIAVIANKSVGVTSIDAGKLASAYSLSMSEWSSGTAVKIGNYRAADELKAKFYGAMKTSETELKKVWMKKKLGEGKETPTLVNSEDEMVEFVKSSSGAIGFVSASKVTGDVVVIMKLK